MMNDVPTITKEERRMIIDQRVMPERFAHNGRAAKFKLAEACEATLSAAEKRIAELLEALRPFALNADRFEEADDYTIYQSTSAENGDLPPLLVWDLARARKAFEGSESKKGTNDA